MSKTNDNSKEKSNIKIEVIYEVDAAYSHCSDRTEQKATSKRSFSTPFD